MKAFSRVFLVFLLLHSLLFVCVFSQDNTTFNVVKNSEETVSLTLSGAKGTKWTIQQSTDMTN